MVVVSMTVNGIDQSDTVHRVQNESAPSPVQIKLYEI